MSDSGLSFLVVERGPDAGKRIKLVRFPVSIGRDPSNDIILADDEVSRHHVRLKQRGRLFVLEDLESRNGSYVNGDRVLNSILKNSDKILLGSTELVFHSQQHHVQFATEMNRLNIPVSKELMNLGPINVTDKPNEDINPIRLSLGNIGHNISGDSEGVRAIYDLHGNILVIDNLEDASATFLKCVMKLMPYASRSALFILTPKQSQLLPVASRNGTKKEFSFSVQAFNDVYTRKQGIILQGADGPDQSSARTRIILPMIRKDECIAFLHIEVDNPKVQLPNKNLEYVMAFTMRCGPSFESLLLRHEIDGWMVGMVETIISTIEANDTYTRGHSERVSKVSMAIADELRLNRETKSLLMMSALVHDVGKIGIPDNILKKAALLTAEEYEEMKLHPSIGADIISHLPNSQRIISGVKYHHEKWDGTGYPDGLEGENIPFFARIVALADVFDAMVSGRSYSGFLDQTDAIERLTEEREIFDPEIFRAFVKAYENGAVTLKTSTQNKIILEAPDGPPENNDEKEPKTS